MKSRCYVIKKAVGDQYYAGKGKWTGFFDETARWSTLKGASQVCNRMIDRCYVAVLRSVPSKAKGGKCPARDGNAAIDQPSEPG